MGFEPEWEEWAYRVFAEIWEAVTLAHDVEPSRLPVEWRPLDYSDPFEEWPHLARDIRIATDHTADRKLKCVSFAGNPVRHKVDLRVFAEWWTESLGRKLPVRFPRTELTATDPAEDLRPAPLAKINNAITAVYDEAEAQREKPPNLNQVVAPVQRKLREQGLLASKSRIQEQAGHPIHAKRRWPTLKNNKSGN
jgi:hypothetical protein